MRDISLLQLALGLAPPWTVTGSDFDAEARRLDIHLDFAAGSRFTCPGCGAADCPAHDTERMTWRHLNFFQHQAYLHARVPRVRCVRCGVKKISVPWAREGGGFTLLFEALVMALVSAMPVNAVARLVGEHDTRLWRVIHHYVERARARTDLAAVTRVAIDETAARRGHHYVSLFVDIDRARVIFATEGKDAATVAAFADDLTAHGGDPDAVAEVCIDMSPAFIKGTGDSLANAAITFDKFHAVKIINDAVDQVRRTERKDHKLLAGTRYLWLRNPDRLSESTGYPRKPTNASSQDCACLPNTIGLPGTLRAIIHRVRSSLPPAMVFLGDPHSAAADHRRRPRRQTSLGRHSTLVPQQDRQRSHRGNQ